MKVINKLFITFILIFLSLNIYSQKDSLNQNGYNIFYYPNGFKQSEGNLKQGKPEGYWTTYFVNGNKKSEGNRKNFLLDSVWIFYAENGDTTEKINYLENQKNGFYYKFYTRYDTAKVNIVKSKELYLQDKKQGFSFYYYSNGNLKEKIKYKDNFKDGQGYEYSKDGRMIAIDEYRYNNLISRQSINRIDNSGKKIGKWVDIYDNGKVKSEINYQNGLPNGNFKEFSPTGKILKIEKFENGKLIDEKVANKYDTLEVKSLRQEKEFYSNGKIKSIKTYKDSLLYGLQLYYKTDGEIEKAEIYDELSQKIAEGIVDILNKKQGKWSFFYDNEKIKSEGNFIDDLKSGEWNYYYEDGSIFEQGTYSEDYPEGIWLWYYPNGKILKSEKYIFGRKSGLNFELDIKGDTIARGNYKEDAKQGKWIYYIGDEYTTGNYYFGQKTGQWETYYYPENKIKNITNYIDGQEDGKYKSYYLNKKLKETGLYSNGKKVGKWTYYLSDGNIDYTIEYLGGEIIKVNDLLIK